MIWVRVLFGSQVKDKRSLSIYIYIFVYTNREIILESLESLYTRSACFGGDNAGVGVSSLASQVTEFYNSCTKRTVVLFHFKCLRDAKILFTSIHCANALLNPKLPGDGMM